MEVLRPSEEEEDPPEATLAPATTGGVGDPGSRRLSDEEATCVVSNGLSIRKGIRAVYKGSISRLRPGNLP